MSKVAVITTNGFEETELVTVMDILRRADVETVLISLKGKELLGAHGIIVKAEEELENFSADGYDMLFFPGGAAAGKLTANPQILDITREFYNSGKYVAAICAAPTILAKAEILREHTVTAYPGYEGYFYDYSPEKVVVSGKIITSKGPGTAVPFALQLVETLCGKEVSDKVAAAFIA
jgi:4-methyl-5(b-hydroxyethyl)-thiazole monophosphate biosynthesis